ncbi:hypothetical protein BC835DRAFT_1290809, partial [Cytidiella melzeri]
HRNLMVDTLLANAEHDDLRAILRATLTSCPPSTATAFTAAARKRLVHLSSRSRPCATSLFDVMEDGLAVPTPNLHACLRRSRSLYGAGMGLTSLSILTEVVQATVGIRWDLDGETADILAAVDADISQAYQSSKEEIASGRVSDHNVTRMTVQGLAAAVNQSLSDCEVWGGEFPFEQALAIVDYGKF